MLYSTNGHNAPSNYGLPIVSTNLFTYASLLIIILNVLFGIHQSFALLIFVKYL